MENDRDTLLNRVELIEAQPLTDRAAGFEQVHDELLHELQRSDTFAPSSSGDRDS